MRVTLCINGIDKVFDINPNEYLLDTLRNNHYFSVKRGCESSSCGVCTVLVNGKPMQSCAVLTIKLDEYKITTIEGIKKESEKLAKHMGEEGADQCGYCNPSLALTAYALKKENPNPTMNEIREYLIGNLCRCTGYQGQNKAIKAYMEDKS